METINQFVNKIGGFDQPEMDSRKQCQCKVLLLDGSDMNVVIAKNAAGRELYDQVFYALDLEERDYFGLQFMDHYHVQHWLDPVKRINKQVPIGPPYTFRFRVKFYSSEPNNLREELTRYQFFLQLKQDIQTGRLECSKDTAIELAALALQSEFGDYSATEHTPAVISEFRFHPEQDEEMEIAILEKFVTCRGQSPATAEMNYLNKAKWIELYGVDMHTVEGKDGNLYSLGLTPTGMLVFDGVQKIGLFLWEKIQKLDFKNRKITLVVEEDADQTSGQVQLHTFVFNLSSHKACKHLWKCAIEHHTFFRLKYHKPRIAKTSQLFRLGSTFRYRGRTEYENVHKDGGRLSRRQSATFERRPSQRYGPRQSLVGASAGQPAADLTVPSESSYTALPNTDKCFLNGNSITSTDNGVAFSGYANSLRTNDAFENSTCDIKELDKSPFVSRRQFNSTKDSTYSRCSPLQLTDDVKKSECVDFNLNMTREPSSGRSGLPVTTAINPATSHITKIAISDSDNSQKPSTISLHDTSTTRPLPRNNSKTSQLEHVLPVSTVSSNARQSHIPRNFPENSSRVKSGSSISNSNIPAVTSDSPLNKIHARSLVRSPLSSPIKSPLNQTFTVLPEKSFQNSSLINGHAHATVSSGPPSRHPSVTNSHVNRISATPTSVISTASTPSEIIRTDTFTIHDRKPLGQAEHKVRSDESNAVSVSHLPESQSRIPHLRTVKCTGTSVIKKPYASSTPVVEASKGNVESVGDKMYRSRLPVRSDRGGSSSTIASEMHGSRTSTSDEKTSLSRIPVMASSVHRLHPQMQLTGQM
uniref:Moesin/ezrin/radixin homolog 1 n=1 Tax=Setaria digitata TaxID=48799 RepID=A0A915PMW2_9BILA